MAESVGYVARNVRRAQTELSPERWSSHEQGEQQSSVNRRRACVLKRVNAWRIQCPSTDSFVYTLDQAQ